jgi:hypothetical protein
MTVVSVIVSIVTIVLGLRLAKYVFFLEDLIEDSLERLEISHASVTESLSIPITMDDAITRSIIENVKLARDTIKDIADKMSVRETEEEE